MVRKLLRSVREYKTSSLLAPLFVTCEVILEVIIPMLMANLIDFGIEAGNMQYILKMGLALIICCIVSLTFGALSGKYAAVASAGFAKNLREDMYNKVQEYSFSNIDKFSTASIVTRLTTDITNIQNAYMMSIRVAVRCPIMLIFALFMAFQINSHLAPIFVIAIPILAVGLVIIISNAKRIFERVFRTYDKLNNVVQENLHGIRVVKSFVREDHETEKFCSVSKEIYQDFSKAEKILAFNAPLMQFCAYGCMLLISWLGAKLIVASGNNPAVGMTTGDLTSMFSYTMQILMSLMMFSMVFVMITISYASMERAEEILDEKSDLHNPENPVYEVKDGSIEFDHVNFAYGKNADKLCLDNVNLKIPSGATVGIIGGTGSSKSTLVQLIPRLYDATEGAVKVGGRDVREYDIESLREEVAMVLQKNVLFSGTVRENLKWGNADASDEEIREACRAACADEFLNRMPDGLDTVLEQGASNLSGGQKQRLCIARALLKRPKILILDDSTSAVDTATEAKIRESLYHDLGDTTKIIIAQRISSVQEADQILVLEDGKIIGHGTHEELLKTCEAYSEIYMTQIGNQSIGAGEEAAV